MILLLPIFVALVALLIAGSVGVRRFVGTETFDSSVGRARPAMVAAGFGLILLVMYINR